MKLDKIFGFLKFRSLANFISETKIGQKKMKMAEIFCVLTVLWKGDSVIAVARDIGISREAFFQLQRSAALLPPGMIPKKKSCSGAPEKTSPRTDKLLKHEVSSY